MIYLVWLLSRCTVKEFAQIAKVFGHIHGSRQGFKQNVILCVTDLLRCVLVSLAGFSKRVDNICPFR